MLSVFRSNQLFNSFLLFIYAAILFSRLWFMPQPAVSFPEGGILYQQLTAQIGTNPFWIGIGGVIILVVSAFTLNFMEFSYRLDKDFHLFPGVFFVLFAAFDTSFTLWSPILLANLFLLVAVYLLMGLGRKTIEKGTLLNIGILLGIAALFYPAYLALLFFGAVALYVQRGLLATEFLIILLGTALVYYLMGGISYLLGFWDMFVTHQGFAAYNWLDISIEKSFPIGLLAWAVLLLVMLFQYTVFTQKRTMQVQRRVSMLFWLLLWSSLTLLVQKNLRTENLLVLSVPIAYLSGIWFFNLKRNWSELLHFLLFLGALAIQWFPNVAPLLFGAVTQK